MLAGHFELAALVLDLAEQACVLDREGRLRRERAKKIDGCRLKRPRSLPEDRESAEQTVFAEERHRKKAPVSSTHEYATHSTLGGCRQDVRQLDRLMHLGEPSGRSFPFSDRGGEHGVDDLGLQMLTGAWQE